MPKPIKATKTINPLHFEDREPHRFEDLVRRLLYGYREWKDIEATGWGGSDEGFDIRAWEISDCGRLREDFSASIGLFASRTGPCVSQTPKSKFVWLPTLDAFRSLTARESLNSNSVSCYVRSRRVGHAQCTQASKYCRFGSCGPVPISASSPRSVMDFSRVSVARWESPMCFATVAVDRASPSPNNPRMRASVSSACRGLIRELKIVARKCVPISSSRGASKPASSHPFTFPYAPPHPFHLTAK